MPRVAVTPLAGSALTRPLALRSMWRRAFRLLKSFAARIDLTDFPPSCCG